MHFLQASHQPNLHLDENPQKKNNMRNQRIWNNRGKNRKQTSCTHESNSDDFRLEMARQYLKNKSSNQISKFSIDSYQNRKLALQDSASYKFKQARRIKQRRQEKHASIDDSFYYRPCVFSSNDENSNVKKNSPTVSCIQAWEKHIAYLTWENHILQLEHQNQQFNSQNYQRGKKRKFDETNS